MSCRQRSPRAATVAIASWTLDDPVESADIGHQIQLAACVFSERDDPTQRTRRRKVRPSACSSGRSPCIREATDDARTVVGMEVLAGESRHARAAVHVAALHIAGAVHMLILQNWWRESRRVAGGSVVAVRPFQNAPPEIQPFAGIRRRRHVDFFPRVLADLSDIKITGLAVERKAPRIAEAPRPGFWHEGRIADEWVVCGNGISARAVDVDPQDLPVEDFLALAILLRVAAAAAVADGYVELAVGTKLQLSAVVIAKGERIAGCGMWDRENRIGRRFVHAVQRCVR